MDLSIEYKPDWGRILLVNVEALSSVKRARELILSFCLQRRVYGVIDEATVIKSPTSKRSKFMVDVVGPSCTHRRILTGLVAPKDPSDVFNQFQFLKPGCLGFSEFDPFIARYAIRKLDYGKGKAKKGGGFQTNKFMKIEGWRDQDELRGRIAKHSYRVRLEDCYDLPPKIYETREVELTDEQERIYGELQRYATAKLSESVYVTALQACTLALRLHQILCGHVGDEEGIRREVETNRLQALLDVLEEIGEDSRVIIWCAYDQDIKNVSKALTNKYGPESVSRFWGGNRSTREEEEKAFLIYPRQRFMVATAAAGGRGRTWTVADTVIYFSNSQDLEHREQSEERAQGIDKVKSVLYVDIVARHQDGRDTIDRAYLESLRRKISMAALLQGDQWKAWVI